MAALHMYLKS